MYCKFETEVLEAGSPKSTFASCEQVTKLFHVLPVIRCRGKKVCIAA